MEESPEQWTINPPRFLLLPTKEKMFLAKYLGAMLKSGIPLDKALFGIHNQTRSRALHRILHVVLTDVVSGEFLSTSLKRFPRVFDNLFTSLVEVGEHSGTLTESLAQIAEHLESVRDLRSKIRGALIYPVIVIFGTVGIAGYLVLVLLPQLLPILSSLSVELPWTTRLVMAVSNFLIHNAVAVSVSVVMTIVLIVLLLRVQKILFWYHRALLKIPVIGKLIIDIHIAQLSSIMGTLLKAGVTIIEALKITADSLENRVYRLRLRNVAESVQEGEDVSSFLAKHRNLFPGYVTQMIAVGEETGKLDESFLYVANFAEREIDDATKILTSVLEPALLLLVGGFVGFIAISIITPIYSVAQGIRI
jgi:type IV pilus assembly protein PilC